jgi:predicted FMN-binding regulatory protein PaiB
MQAAYKLSQNRDEQSYQQVISKLKDGDTSSREIAKAMQHKASSLFKNNNHKEG